MPERLKTGSRHQCRVLLQAPFGIAVEVLDAPNEPEAIVDLFFISEEMRSAFPPVGSVIEATVQGYTPSGQLRFSMHPEDLARHP